MATFIGAILGYSWGWAAGAKLYREAGVKAGTNLALDAFVEGARGVADAIAAKHADPSGPPYDPHAHFNRWIAKKSAPDHRGDP